MARQFEIWQPPSHCGSRGELRRHQAEHGLGLSRRLPYPSRMHRQNLTDGDDIQPVIVPRNDERLAAVSRERKQRLHEHLIKELADLRKAKHLEHFASPERPEPAGFAARVAKTACSLCKGFCCRNGGDDAFLDDRTLARVRLAKPALTEGALRSLEAVGRTAATKVTAFTDGCPGLRSILADPDVATRPIADWFHIAMRLQHAELAASGLLADEPARKKAKVTIVAEVERLHWRIWNGKAKNAQKTFDRIRKFMHLYKGERGHRTRGVTSRKLWHALHEIDKYLRSQSVRLVNYAARHRAGMRVETAVTEGTANFLVNRRMNKSQQMRWSRRGADLVLQVRCAVYSGTLGSGFGQRFEPIGRQGAPVAIAA